MSRRKRSAVNQDPNSFFSSFRPLGGIYHAIHSRFTTRHRDAPLTSKAQVIFDAILIFVIVGCAAMIFFAARG